MTKKQKKLIFLAGKIVISIAIFALVIGQVDVKKAWSEVGSVDITFLLVAIALEPFLILSMTLKWQLLVRQHVKVTFKRLLTIYWASDFLNLFMVGSVGSELYKMLAFGNNKSRILFSSLFDRLLALSWYVIFVASMLCARAFFDSTPIILAAGFSAFSIGAFFSSHLVSHLTQFLSHRITHPRLLSILHESKVTPQTYSLHAFYSVCYIISSSLMVLEFFAAVGISASIVDLLVFVPILAVATALPISFQGIGIREFLFLQFAAFRDLSSEKVLLVAFMIFLLALVYRLFGVIPFLTLKRETSQSAE